MRAYRGLRLALATSGFLALLCVLGIAWLLATPAGLRTVLDAGERYIPGLRIEQAEGTLAGAAHIGRLAYATPGWTVTAHEVDLTWHPIRLLNGLLAIDRLTSQRLEIVGTGAMQRGPPASLRLPLAVRIDAFEIGQASVIEVPGRQSVAQVDAIAGRFASDGRVHDLKDTRFRIGRFDVKASARLGGDAPFAVLADAEILVAETARPSISLTLSARNSLESLALTATARSGATRLNGSAHLRTFAERPIERAYLAATGLDPFDWIAGAPHAKLDGQLNAFAAGGRLRGSVFTVNRDPGRLDEGRIPLVELRAELGEAGEQFDIRSFVARFVHGAGAGSGGWRDGRLELDARVAGMDASDWHRKLHKTSLAGPLRATLSIQEQHIQTRLRDARFDLALDAARRDGRIDIARVLLSHRGGELSGSGRIVPAGRYDFSGRLRNFDPGMLVDAARGRINAELQAAGGLGAAPTLDLRFQLRDSRIAGHAIAGRGQATLHTDQTLSVNAAIQAGDNRLEVAGSLGSASSALTVSVAAPRLDQIGLAGALRGKAVLRGAVRSPGARWSFNSPHLAFPGGAIDQLETEGDWDPHEHESIEARIVMGQLRLATRHAANVSFRLRGRRAEHRLEAAAQLADDAAIVTASGGFGNDKVWRGHIDALKVTGRHPLHLTSPAALQASARRLVLDDARLAGEEWHAAIERLHWENGRLQSRGRIDGLPVAMLAPSFDAGSLRVGGDWDFALDHEANGYVRLFRKQGDVSVMAGDERLALGLSEASVRAEFSQQKMTLSFRAQGSRSGSMEGEIVATIESGETGWQLARRAPWQGSARVDAASIAWLSPLAGPDVALDGRLHASVAVSGTPARPQTNGSVSVDGLRIRLLEYGVDLRGDALRIDLAQDIVRLRPLELSTAAQPPPDPRIPFDGRPGRLAVQGQITADGDRGSVQLKAERLVVSQTEDRWIMISGLGSIDLAGRHPSVSGDVDIDGAYVALAPANRPRLAPDVVISGHRETKQRFPVVATDVSVDLGRHFHFNGAGIESRLAGRLHLTGSDSQLRARGSVHTVEGTFNAYGQKLAVERGILNFQGLPDNPGLNVRALRKNQPVEAGVEVTGTLAEPRVRLVSVPDVPDAEKLSWLILGRPPGASVGSADASLLLSAAISLRSGQGKGGLPSLMQELGIEDIAVSSGTLGESSRFSSSHVAGGFTADGSSAAEQIATVGKRIGSNAVLSYQRSLASAESIVKLTIELTRHLSVVGSVGADNAIGLVYSFTFGERRSGSREAPP